jgi:AcrR family transcriptional regulator
MSELSADTKTRILDVAEELFAEEGIDRVSIRDITEGARVNLAAVNYHFGGKEDLIASVFERRVRPVNEARIAALTEVEEKAGHRPPKVEDILAAFIQPALACCPGDKKAATAFAKLFGRCLAEPRPDIEKLLRRQFEPLVERLEGALMRSLPRLSREDIFWRMKFTFGALHHWL